MNTKRSYHYLLIVLILLMTGGCQRLAEKTFDEISDDSSSILTQKQIEKMAFGAVYGTNDAMHYVTLAGKSASHLEVTVARLDNAWSITSHNTAIRALDWLLNKGHRLPLGPDYYGFDDIYLKISGKQECSKREQEALLLEQQNYNTITQFLKENYDFTESELASISTTSAWDYDRLITITRLCYSVGYISEEEAWYYIDAATAQAREDYDDWRTYFAGIAFGWMLWSGESQLSEDNNEIIRHLLTDECSIYRKVSFQP